MIDDPDYARTFTIARCIAWQEGYAMTVHGTMTRDLDLLAVPWTEQAGDPEHMVARIVDACDWLEAHDSIADKPHGRRTWTLIFKAFGDPRWVDLSIFPPITA